MAPLIALVSGFAVSKLFGLPWAESLRGGLALMFLVTASAHFVPKMRADLIAMVPPSLPRPDLLVTITGVLEIAGAVGLLIPATAPWAAGCLALLMVAMFPANVSAARRKVPFGGRPATPLVPRILEQILFVAAAIAAI
ncbi:DoxX family protein [Allorhizocola rhizosphaerae]|uniref:DoxX family protein n=1 Tax=Allorhizocola rhizosphaerae TaxID=1872709 RepID=UPI000E3BE9C9|nr:DoxX family protein [Allorhizocola rhizosphaerae]